MSGAVPVRARRGTLTDVIDAVRRLLRRRLLGRPLWVWSLWLLGALVVVATPMALTEPGMWSYLLDPELVALMVAVGLRYTGLQLRMALLPFRRRC